MARRSNVKVKDIDKGWKKIKADVSAMAGKFVKVGVPAGESDSDGNSIAAYAIKNEFGTETIPARPFMRTTYDNKLDDINKIIEGFTGQIIDGKITVDTALDRLGLWYVPQIQNTIKNHPWQPNAPLTVSLKGFNQPLIDTRSLLLSITYRVM